MHRERLLTVLTAILLSLAAAAGTAGCVITAFDLPMARAQLLLPVFLLAALLCAVAFSFRRGGIVLIFLIPAAVFRLWQLKTPARQTADLFWQICSIYDRAYGWGLLKQEALPAPSPADWPMAILGVGIIAIFCRCICRRGRAWPGVVSCLLPLFACVVVTDTVPEEPWLLLVMAALFLLILPASLRRENILQSLKLTAMAALPVLLALAGLFWAIPQESYVNHSADFRDSLLTRLQTMPDRLETQVLRLASGLRSGEARQVDLENLGPRIPFAYPVMEVTTQTGGTLYLRGQSFSGYTGLGWEAGETPPEDFSRRWDSSDHITIRSFGPLALQYLPYYPGEEALLTGGALKNRENSETYSFSRQLLPENWRQTACGPALDTPVPGEAFAPFLTLPDSTLLRARNLVTHLTDLSGHTEKADLIAALVMDSAQYDLEPPTMPPGEQDFALWFLEEGESGYCVHFASAAVVLLRAAGVPARYVTGYLTEAAPGETVTVTEEQAHAWAEYYEPRLDCWIPLEATPASQRTPIAPLPGEMPPETTQPETLPQTIPETEPVTAETQAAETQPPETPPAPPAQGTLPTPEAAPVPPPQTPPRRIPWLSLLMLPLAVCLAAGQRYLRLELRRRRCRRGSPNDQALARWQEAEYLSRLTGQAPPEDLMALAQKAKFSQHRLSPQELQQFDSHIRRCQRHLQEKPWYLRLYYKYLRAAY